MRSNKFVLTAIAAVGLASCTEKGTLRVDGQISESSAALTTPGAGRLELGGGKLVVTRARIAVSEIELEGGSEDDEREAEMGVAVIDLALDGSATNVRVDEVEAGSYHTLGLELHVADATLVAFAGGRSAQLLDFGRGDPASILVSGTYDGQPFEFRSGLSPEAEFWLRPEVEVPPEGEATVAVVFDVAAWFTSSDGSVLDPRDRANQAAIEGKIMASIAARAQIEGPDDD